MTSAIDVLFWFYRDPAVTANHLAVVRAGSPDAQVFGLYGGDPAKLQEFRHTLDQLDDIWVHPPVTTDEAWFDGDRMLACWYLERGITLPWSQLFIHQWDLVLRGNVNRFALTEPERAILLPGSRPLAEVADSWIWVQPWSHHRYRFDEFRSHLMVASADPWACVFIFAGLSRTFFDAWSAPTLEVPGFIEYRMPTLARILGFGFQPCSEAPDWGDGTNAAATLNGHGHPVDVDCIYADLTSHAWHPVYDPVDPSRLHGQTRSGRIGPSSGHRSSRYPRASSASARRRWWP